VLAKFTDLLDPRVQIGLIEQNVIFIANRSFEVYLHQKFSYDEIERRMLVPFFGNRRLLRAEERDEANNQYDLMQQAGIRFPQQFEAPEEIDRLVMVKAPHAKISFERAFFLVRNPAEYAEKSEQLIAAGIVTRKGLKNALIEEFAIGPSVNLNFFYSPLLGELELLGTDTRRQTNLDGLRGLPFAQAQQLIDEPVRMEEAGHIATTLTESMPRESLRDGREIRARHAERRSARRDRAVRAAMHHRRGSTQELRVLRCLAADSGLARNALYALYGISLGPRRVGRRAHCDGSRDGARRKPPGRGPDLTR